MSSVDRKPSARLISNGIALMARPLLGAASLVVGVTAIAYFYGYQYYSGFLSEVGARWALPMMDAMFVAKALMLKLVALGLITWVIVEQFAKQVLSETGLRRGLKWTAAISIVCLAIHSVVDTWMPSFKSYWYEGAIMAGAFFAAFTAALTLVTASDRKTGIVAIGSFWVFMISTVGLLAVPYLGQLSAERVIDGGEESPFVQLGDQPCVWVLITPLSSDDLLVGRVDTSPMGFRVVGKREVSGFRARSGSLCEVTGGTN